MFLKFYLTLSLNFLTETASVKGMKGLREEIVELLREKPMASTELRDVLMDKGLTFSPLEFRETLAELVRQGVIEKYPDYERKKFYFRLKS